MVKAAVIIFRLHSNTPTYSKYMFPPRGVRQGTDWTNRQKVYDSHNLEHRSNIYCSDILLF
jgi:hypothetical protein